MSQQVFVVEIRRRGGGRIPGAWMRAAEEAAQRVSGVAAVRRVGEIDPSDPRSGARLELVVDGRDGRAAARDVVAVAQAALPSAICLWSAAPGAESR